MLDYLYDGSFEGFLTCVHYHYYYDKANNISDKSCYQPNLLFPAFEVVTDLEKTDTVYRAIENKISSFDLKRIYRVFRSSAENKELYLLNYIRFGFKQGSKVSLFHGSPYVSPVEKIDKNISNEIYRMIELLRFSVLEGNVLYAEYEPDHDITEFLADHFTDRYKYEAFIIHDKKRNKALVYFSGRWVITEFTKANIPRLSAAEEEYRALWKRYFESIAIEERTNPKCQRGRMPVRYWKHLTEMQQSSNQKGVKPY